MTNKTLRLCVLAGLCFVTVAAFMAFVPLTCLTAEDEHGTIVYITPVTTGDRYAVRFIHSVARRPVDEIYEIGDGCSVLVETVYDMMGAGLPHCPEPGQKFFTTPDGKYHITGYHVAIPVLTYRVNKVVADHTLLIDGKVYPLRHWIKPGRPVTFRVGSRSAGLYVYYKLHSLFRFH